VHIYKIIIGLVTRTELLEQQARHFEVLRLEDEARRKEQRGELLATMIARFDKLETRIKNGQ
jgi:hypothetical protein